MSYLPELRESLVRAAERRRSTPVVERRRPRVGWLGPAVAVGVTIAVALVALVLVGHRGHAPSSAGMGGQALRLTVPPPPPSPHPTAARWTLIERARRATVSHDPACSPNVTPPRFSPGAPAPALTSILGVLRRPARPTDSAPLEFSPLGPAGIYKNAIRRARYVDGVGLYVVPTANVLGLKPVPTRCLSEEANALRRQAKSARSVQVAAALGAQRAFLTWQQYEARHPEGICLAEVDHGGAGSLGCGAGVGEIEEGVAGLGETDSPGPSFFHGIVPDGVASVVLQLPRHLGNVSAKVVNNMFVAPMARNVQKPARIVWRAADGAVIKTTVVP